MKLSTDLEEEITLRVSEVFHDLIDIRNMKIELSSTYSKNQKPIFYKMLDNNKIGIEGYFGRYDVRGRKIILFLPVISEPCSRISHSFDRFLRIIKFFEIGQWVSHNMKWNEKALSDKKFRKTGKMYRIFISLMYAFELLKYDDLLIDEFYEVVESLSDDYTLCLKFIRNEGYKLPGVELPTIIEFNREIIEFEREKITKGDIMDFDGFNQYIDNCIKKNPVAIEFFMEVMTETQKKHWSHLNEDHGFFPR